MGFGVVKLSYVFCFVGKFLVGVILWVLWTIILVGFGCNLRRLYLVSLLGCLEEYGSPSSAFV